MSESPDRYAIPSLAGLSEQAVVVRVGKAEFGIRVTLVREVLHVPRITRLPFPDPSLPGLISVRGSILPLVDLGVRLFQAPCDRKGRIVLIETEESGEVALLVDAVIDLVPTTAVGNVEDEIEESLPKGWMEAVISPSENRLVTLLSMTPVLSRGTPPENN